MCPYNKSAALPGMPADGGNAAGAEWSDLPPAHGAVQVAVERLCAERKTGSQKKRARGTERHVQIVLRIIVVSMGRWSRFLLAAAILGATWLLAARLEDTFYVPLDDPAIHYAQKTGDDAVARLGKKVESGEVKLDYAPNGFGYLPALLKELDIDVDSQALVFSKTSIQANHISPATPRAIYFNDDVSVGFVRGGDVLEITALDPRQGIQLYSIDTDRVEKPDFSQRDDCLQCHQGPATLGVPGLLVSSVHPSNGGRVGEHGNDYITDDRTPFAERWGGWYVTGTHGTQYDLGNNVNLVDPLHPGGASTEGTQNVLSLGNMFDTSKYLAPTSDIVALMVLEHQTRMTNLMTRIGWDVRIAQHDGKLKEEEAKLDGEIDELADYMMFRDEAPLKSPVTGVSTFTKTFAERGPRDQQGRCLRDFDLKTRMFRYPLSYMIYSAAFDGMPEFARERVYRRLYDALNDPAATEGRAIIEILRATKHDLPSYFVGKARAER